MYGLNALVSARKAVPRIPVLVLVGSDQAKVAVEALKLGATEVCVMPVNPADLLSFLRKMHFDSHVSPVGVRGSASERRMRFICREFDIYVKLMDSSKDMSLSGRMVANDVVPGMSLITLLFDSEPYATTATDALGKFRLDQIPSGKATLEVVVPSYRIVAPLM